MLPYITVFVFIQVKNTLKSCGGQPPIVFLFASLQEFQLIIVEVVLDGVIRPGPGHGPFNAGYPFLIGGLRRKVIKLMC